MVKQFRGAIPFDEGGAWDADDVPFLPVDSSRGDRHASARPSGKSDPHKRSTGPEFEPRTRQFDYPPSGTIKRYLQVHVSPAQYNALRLALAAQGKSFQRQLIEWMLPHLEQWHAKWGHDPNYTPARITSPRPDNAKLLGFQVTPQHNYAARREAESLNIGACDLVMATISDPLQQLLRKAA